MDLRSKECTEGSGFQDEVSKLKSKASRSLPQDYIHTPYDYRHTDRCSGVAMFQPVLHDKQIYFEIGFHLFVLGLPSNLGQCTAITSLKNLSICDI